MLKRYSYYIWALIVYTVALSVYVYNGYENERKAMYDSIDKELIQGAQAVPILLEKDFHNQILTHSSVSHDSDINHIKKLSEFVNLTRLVYIYSCIDDGKNIRFTSSSATKEEWKTKKGLSYYFDVYEDAPPTIRKSLKEHRVVFDELTDQWGTFRSVYISHKTSSGMTFVTGADIRIDFIKHELNLILWHSILEALFYIAILIPFFIAFWLVNRKINAHLEETIQIRTQELGESKEQISLLLNNADQGFLSFSSDCLIHKEYSKACIKLLGNNLENKHIGDILFKNIRQKDLFVNTITDIVSQADEIAQSYLLTLLPREIILNKKALKIDYKLIAADKFMAIITNISVQKKLENKIKKEQATLKMIVEIVSDSEIFYDTIKDYEIFLSSLNSYVDNNRTPLGNLNEIYRIIHTFKGAFSQLYMQSVVQFLHEIETKISTIIKENKTSNDGLLVILHENNFKTSLEDELKVITDILGAEFLTDSNYAKINIHYLQEIRQKSFELLKNDDTILDHYKNLTEQILNFSQTKLINVLKPYNNLVNQLSQRVKKEIYKFEVIGDVNLGIRDDYKPFMKTLIHLFRNSIDHGIEDAEIRVENNKDEKGTICCNFERIDNILQLVISDDGAGIDTQRVLQKAIENGLIDPNQAPLLSDAEIYNFIFSDQLSTKDEITDLSGRGVGMSAVKAELAKLKGTIEIKSSKNIGSTFIFTLPYEELV